MSLADDLAAQWGGNPTVKKDVAKKKKVTPKKTVIVKDTEKFDEQIRDAFNGGETVSPDMEELYNLSTEAKLKLDILKAEQLEYKIKQEQIKLERDTGNLIEYGMAEFLFFGFMKKTNMQILTLIKKIEPDIKNLCQENEPEQLLKDLQRNLESIVKDIQNQQIKDVKDWKKGL